MNPESFHQNESFLAEFTSESTPIINNGFIGFFNKKPKVSVVNVTFEVE